MSQAHTPETLLDVLEVALEHDPDRVFLETPQGELTVAGLESASLSVAAGLRSEGIEPGDRVALMMGNVPEFVSSWFGILRAGAIEVPVHNAYKGPQLQHVLGESEPRLLIADADLMPRFDGLELPSIERIVVRGRGAPEGLAAMSLDELSGPPDPSADAPIDRRTISCILYTSGTTGPSKGVALPQGANLQLTQANIGLMGYGADDVLYTAFPLFHVNAKFTSVVSALLCGGRLILDERFSASGFWDRMRDRGVTAFNYMGSMLTILDKQPPRLDDSENPVRRCYGAACPPSLWEPFEERFDVQLREHYGMTEVGIATMNTASASRVGSIGRAAAYFDVAVVGEDDRPLTDGERGEIVVRPREPATIVDHYWRRLDATADAFRDLWFHTGDVGWRDPDGYFHFVDRTKDCIRRRGENVSSFEVESVVNSHPDVLESAAFGVPSELGEEEVAIAVVGRGDRDADPVALLNHCQEHLPYFAVPRYVVSAREIPKNASQRIEKFRLRERGIPDGAFDATAAGYVVRR